VFAVAKWAVLYIQSRQAMSPLEWVGLVALGMSALYGAVELAAFLFRLHKRIAAVERIGVEWRLQRMEKWWQKGEDFDLLAFRTMPDTEKP